MKFVVRHFAGVIPAAAGIILLACYTLAPARVNQTGPVELKTVFPDAAHASVMFDDSIIATPLLFSWHGKPKIIVAVANGIIAALDGETGVSDWQLQVPVPEGQQAQLVSTPAMTGDKLVVLYQCLENGVRASHRMAVIDMSKKRLDDTFPVLVFSAEKLSADGGAVIKFNPPTAFSHAAVKHAAKSGTELGYVYASFGNAGDTQPFHGWLFEIDLDAWRKQGVKQAIRSVLLTTPEAECPVTVEYGTQEMICGGGIWTPAGPMIYPAGEDFEILVATGNGQIDLDRRDYANTAMRLKPGLQFEPGCDVRQCANFNADNPDRDCLESCKNLFIPRLADGNAPLKPAGHDCDNKTFWQCLAWMDYDLGASAPVKVVLKQGASVLVQPGKDGGVYLIDADHLGMQYDRLQIVDLCGTPADPCKTPWSGMIVTQPAVSFIDNVPVVVIPTFVPDKSTPAGLVALTIVLENGVPKFKRHWQFPDPASPESIRSFRSQPTFPVVTAAGKNADPLVWIVDIGFNGTVYGIRIKDGKLVAKATMKGTGRPLTAPLIHDGHMYLASSLPGTGKAMIEAYRIEPDK